MNFKTGSGKPIKQLTKEEWKDAVLYPNKERETVVISPVKEELANAEETVKEEPKKAAKKEEKK